MSSVIIIPDIHGDLNSMEQSLRHAQTFCHGSDEIEQLIFLGDYINQGTNNIGVLDKALEIKDEFKERAIFQIGNHEFMALQALTHPNDFKLTIDWLKRGGHLTLKEIAIHLKIPVLETECTDAHPLKNYEKAENHQETAELLSLWNDILRSNSNYKLIDFPAAFEAARNLFLGEQSPYSVFFRNLKLTHNINEHIVTVHAGINKFSLEKGNQQIALDYQEAWNNFDFAPYCASYRQDIRNGINAIVSMSKPRDNIYHKLFDGDLAQELVDRGIFAVIHGHAAIGPHYPEPRRQTVQSCQPKSGNQQVADINCDLAINRYSELHTGITAAFVHCDLESMNLKGFSIKGNSSAFINFGKVTDDSFQIDSNTELAMKNIFSIKS